MNEKYNQQQNPAKHLVAASGCLALMGCGIAYQFNSENNVGMATAIFAGVGAYGLFKKSISVLSNNLVERETQKQAGDTNNQ